MLSSQLQVFLQKIWMKKALKSRISKCIFAFYFMLCQNPCSLGQFPKIRYNPMSCHTSCSCNVSMHVHWYSAHDNMCFSFLPTQDLDRIAEANELFDAVLTGSVDQDKEVTTNAAPTNKAPAPKEAKSTTFKKTNPFRRLSLYIGNFPWVSNTLSGSRWLHFYCTVQYHCSCHFLTLFSQTSFYLQWTSDKDIICMAQTLGVRDIKEVKFAENKVNGQSRGWVVAGLV